MAIYQAGIDVSRYQSNVNWQRVAAAGKKFVIVRIGSSNSSGLYVDPYFLQNVNGAHAAGLAVGAYYYTYAKTQTEVLRELDVFLNAMSGLQFEYPVYVDVEANSLTSLGRTQLTSLVRYAMDILTQRKWYSGWYSYTSFINSYLNPAALLPNPLWVADYRSSLGYTGAYSMWQYSGSGSVNGISGAVDLNYSYANFLPAIQAGGFNGYGSSGPSMIDVSGYTLRVFGTQTEYFYTPNFNDIVGYLPVGSYPILRISSAPYNGYNWAVFRYNNGEYWTAVLDDRLSLQLEGGAGGEN